MSKENVKSKHILCQYITKIRTLRASYQTASSSPRNSETPRCDSGFMRAATFILGTQVRCDYRERIPLYRFSRLYCVLLYKSIGGTGHVFQSSGRSVRVSAWMSGEKEWQIVVNRAL